MKALKSKLATKLFADAKAKDQLLMYLMDKHVEIGGNSKSPSKIEIHTKDGTIQVNAVVVSKALKAA